MAMEGLTTEEIEQFIRSGYVCVENAFSPGLAETCGDILWKDTGCDPNDPSTWIHPVVRLGGYSQEPFRQAANTPILHRAADQLVGKGRWAPLGSVGTFLFVSQVIKIQETPDGTQTPASMARMGPCGSMSTQKAGRC